MTNRRRDRQSFGLSWAVRVIIVASVPTIMALVFVGQGTTVKQLNDRLIEREQRLAMIQDEIRIKQARLAQQVNPEWLRRRIAEMGLDLREVEAGQIVRAYGAPLERSSRVARLDGVGTPR
jgi:hypothetical protein